MNTENTTKKRFTKPRFNNRKVRVQKALDKTPEHLKNLVYLLLNNAEIRRFTALGIINIMKQKQIVPADASCYVNFNVTKYSISVNGFKQEHSYNNNIFVTALCASFPSFAYNANKIIETFINVENSVIDESAITDVVEAIKDNSNSPVEEESSQN